MNSDSYLYLYELDDDTITFLITAESSKITAYIDSLIDRYFVSNNSTVVNREQLINSYTASFLLEYVYRRSETLNKHFTPIYTKYGMIREITLDLYGIGLEKTSVH